MAYDPQNPMQSSGSPYDVVRQRSNQKYDQQKQQGNEALQRRFAAMGALNSGAALKAEQLNNQQVDEAKDMAARDIDLQEQEGANQRNFASQEAEKARQFQGQQNQLQRDMGSRELDLRKYLGELEQSNTAKRLDLELKNSDLEREAMYFNQDMANWEKKHSGGLLGAGGFLGTGIGNGGTFFCTELFKRGLATKKELVSMRKFFMAAIFSRPNQVLFYLKNGPKIVERANNEGFDWSSIKTKAFDEVLTAFKDGKTEEAFDLYWGLVMFMTLRFAQDAWIETNTSVWQKLKAIPGLLFNKYFWINI